MTKHKENSSITVLVPIYYSKIGEPERQRQTEGGRQRGRERDKERGRETEIERRRQRETDREIEREGGTLFAETKKN